MGFCFFGAIDLDVFAMLAIRCVCTQSVVHFCNVCFYLFILCPTRAAAFPCGLTSPNVLSSPRATSTCHIYPQCIQRSSIMKSNLSPNVKRADRKKNKKTRLSQVSGCERLIFNKTTVQLLTSIGQVSFIHLFGSGNRCRPIVVGVKVQMRRKSTNVDADATWPCHVEKHTREMMMANTEI